MFNPSLRIQPLKKYIFLNIKYIYLYIDIESSIYLHIDICFIIS